MDVGVFNGPDGYIVVFRYLQGRIDRWKSQPGKSGLSDAEAFEEIVLAVAHGAEYSIFDESLLPEPYYWTGATYNHTTSEYTYNMELVNAEIERYRVSAVSGVQDHMDIIANSLGYDNILSAVSYATEPIVESFQLEGIAFREWRSLVWAFCYTINSAWVIGDQVITANDIINHVDFPALILPE